MTTRNLPVTLRWRATSFNGEPAAHPDHDGILVDDGHAVGRVRNDPVPSNPELPEWGWWMQAHGRGRRSVAHSGRAATKAEAKSSVEEAYSAFCNVPGARDAFMTRSRASQAAMDAWAKKHGR